MEARPLKITRKTAHVEASPIPQNMTARLIKRDINNNINKKMSQRHILNLDKFHFLPQILVSKLILYPFLMSGNPRQNIFLEMNV